MADYLSTVEKGNATWQGYEEYVREANRANEQMTLSAKAGTAIMKGFSFALNVGISALISWASSLAIQWIDNYIHRVDKAKESMEEITATIADVNSTFQSARKTVADSGKRFAELSQEVNQLTGANKTLSTAEYEEFLDLSNQLAELFPTLPKIYDENGNAIVRLSGDVDTIVESLKNLVDTERILANQQIADNLPQLYENTQTLAASYRKDLEAATASLEYYQGLVNGFYNINLDTIPIKSGTDGFGNEISTITGNTQELTAYKKIFYEAGIEGLSYISSKDESGNELITKIEIIDEEAFQESLEEAKNELSQISHDYAETYNREVETFSAQISSTKTDQTLSFNNLSRSLTAWVSGNEDYTLLNDDVQASVLAMLGSLDYDSLLKEHGDADSLKNYITQSIIDPLSGNSALQQAYIDFFSLTPGDLDRIKAAKTLQSYFNSLGITIDVMPMVTDEVNASQRLEAAMQKLAIGTTVSTGEDREKLLASDDYQSLRDFTKTLEGEEVDLFLEIAAASQSAAEAMAAFEQESQKLYQQALFPDYSTLADTADQTATAADSLHSAMSTLNNAFAEQAEHGSISTDTMLKLAEAGYATALSFDEETGACTINAQAMRELAKAKIQNQIADLQSLKTDIASKLQNEGIIASASAQGFIDLAKAKTVAAAANGLTAEQSGAIDDFNNAEAEILALQNMLQNFDQVEAGQYSSSFSNSSSKSETDYKSLLDKETSLLEKQLAANLITFSDYLDKRKSLLDDYYTLGKITAEEYYDGLSSLYESQLSTYDKVVGAVTNRIDKEINSLEKQKEVIEESYRFKIDAVQAEIDALNKENEARKKQIALEQAQYEAERARNQRSVKQFVNGQFVYMADMDEVKAAEENLAEQEQQMEISRLEDQIASLEQEMENATASLDNQISALEAYKEQWSEISSVYEEQQNALITAEILGADWEAQVLSGRLATLQAFTNQYIALQQAQANAAAQAAQTPTPPANNNGNAGEQTTHAYYAMTRTGQTVTATPFSSSTEAWNWLVNTYGSLDAHQNYKVVQKYADGGVIGAQPGLLDFIAQAVNEDHLIAARQGERILTATQNKQFEALVKLAPELLSMHHPLQNLSVPDSFRTLSTPASTPNITIGDIHLHNVNDVNSLSRAIIQRLPGQMMQAIHRH